MTEQVFRREPVSFTRRGGRLTERQQRGWDNHSERYLIELPRGESSTSVTPDYVFDHAAAFGRVAPLIVEIGSGRGDAIIHAAAEHPEHDFLALEVWTPGVAQTMVTAAHVDVDNLRIAQVDAAEALATMLAPESVHEVRVFFPDPWHKKRHNKRRLVDPEFAQRVVRVLEPGGHLRLATDWEDYALWMSEVLDAAPGLTRTHTETWAPRFEGRPTTRFERKGELLERAIRDLTYLRT